jgi:hypothetical protein
MADLSERDPLLVLVDDLVRETDAPVLVPDLRGLVTYTLDPPRARVLFAAPTMIFHVLRDMVADGLIVHTPGGYEPTEAGTEEAQLVRERDPDFAQRAADAIRAYAS